MNKKILYTLLLWVNLFLPIAVYGGAAGPTGACHFLSSIQSGLLTVAVSIVVISWIIAGVLWLVSAGSPEKMGTAKKATIAAVIGTAIIAIADLMYVVILQLLGLTGGPAGC